MRILRVLAVLSVFTVAHAQQVQSPVDGNNIPEPELKDYQSASRTPGILYEPYDVVDQNGLPVTY